MAKWLMMLTMMMGCATYFGDDAGEAPDAAVIAPVDSEPVECEPTLPACAELYCGLGAVPLDCPRSDDTSVCYCPSPTPGWCRNE